MLGKACPNYIPIQIANYHYNQLNLRDIINSSNKKINGLEI